jgi:aspartate/methionine/tyrosine aminotransferase
MTFANTVVRQFGTSVFSEMSRLAREHDAINLGQGFPDFPGPTFVKEAAKAAIDRDENQYAISHGSARLRQAIACSWSSRYGGEIDPEQEVTITSGATEAIFDALQSYLDPGDEVIAFEPFYDSYLASVMLAGARFVPMTLQPPDWAFDVERLRAAVTKRTKAILLNTPHNPTGKVFNSEELVTIAEICQEHDLIAISDEVYDRITYGNAEHIPLATLPGMWERTLTINSTGKTFSMTGWKIGFAIGPSALSEPLRAVHQFVTFATATPFQEAMADAFELAETNGYYEELREEYVGRRLILDDGLRSAGLTPLPIEGSYFLMSDLNGLPFRDDVSFCRWLVREIGVAAVPPSAFYVEPNRAPLLARFCFAKQESTLIAAAERLVNLRERLPRTDAAS